MQQIITSHFSELIIAIATISAAVLAAYYTLKGQLRRDEKNRLYEQRKIAYEETINLFMDVFKIFFENFSLGDKVSDEDFFKALKLIVIYGSPAIIGKMNKIENMNKSERDILQAFYLVEELIFEMRKEINPKVKYRKEEILSLIPKWREFKTKINKTK